jgi:sugar phosphate isomerase/epimerase
MSLLDRLSLNQITTQRWDLQQAVDGCVRNEVPWIGVWREKIHEFGAEHSARLIRDAGLKVSSVCRGGFFPAPTEGERKARIDESRRAIEEAALLGASTLVLVCGPPFDKDLAGARAMVAEGIAALVPDAAAHKVKLGIEPLHPMMLGQRSVICTLAEANALAGQFHAEHVGVVVDVFHVWWDPTLYSEIARAAGRILGFHISDWVEPLPDIIYGRAMPGDGLIDLRRIHQAVFEAGYRGPIEVEILNTAIWERPGDEVLREMKERIVEHL